MNVLHIYYAVVKLTAKFFEFAREGDSCLLLPWKTVINFEALVERALKGEAKLARESDVFVELIIESSWNSKVLLRNVGADGVAPSFSRVLTNRHIDPLSQSSSTINSVGCQLRALKWQTGWL
jgi:hypothetical protein